MISGDPLSPPPQLWCADEPKLVVYWGARFPPRAERTVATHYGRADDMPPRQFIGRFTPSAPAVVIRPVVAEPRANATAARSSSPGPTTEDSFQRRSRSREAPYRAQKGEHRVQYA